MRAETPAEQLFFTTVYLRAENAGQTWTGTGFLLSYPTTPVGQAVPVLVTNKHVLDGATTLTVRMVKAGPNGDPLAEATETQIVGFGHQAWVGHPNTSVDVAVMLFGPIVNQMTQEGRAPFFKTFTPSLLLTETQASELDALEQVTFIGYPNGLFDTHSFLPIARRGQTATPLQNDYRGTAAFLIDASVFGGSSGSPVMIFDRGTFTDRRGNTTVGQRLHLVGVLAAVHTRQAAGTVIDLPAKQVAVFEDPIDLGIVYKASAIQETVDILFVAANVIVAPEVPSSEVLE